MEVHSKADFPKLSFGFNEEVTYREGFTGKHKFNQLLQEGIMAETVPQNVKLHILSTVFPELPETVVNYYKEDDLLHLNGAGAERLTHCFKNLLSSEYSQKICYATL